MSSFLNLDFLVLGMTEDTLFHKIRDGEVPSHRVYEDEDVIGFLDINPATRGHTLLIPREHSVGLQDTAVETWSSLISAAKELASRYEDRLGCDGFNVVQSSGEAAEQEVAYVHVHLIPRYDDDAFSLWGGRPADPDLEALAAELR